MAAAALNYWANPTSDIGVIVVAAQERIIVRVIRVQVVVKKIFIMDEVVIVFGAGEVAIDEWFSFNRM